jgi:hypothetical protein
MTRTMCSYETYINMANIPSIPYIINARATVGKGTPAPLSVTGGAIYPAGSARSAISQEQSVLCCAHTRTTVQSSIPPCRVRRRSSLKNRDGKTPVISGNYSLAGFFFQNSGMDLNGRRASRTREECSKTLLPRLLRLEC